MQHLQPGSTLQSGRYKIEKMLGQGGFGITYLAEQTMLNRKVAIKEFFMKELCNRDESTSMVSVPSTGSIETVARFKEKFLKEARNIAKFNHPNIVRIIDVFEENGTAYYVMEYAENGSLADKVKQKGYLAEPVATRYILQVADALDYIHQQKMNHLDVKPANIMLNEKDESVLIDFGLSKQYDAATGNQTSTTPVGISEGYAPMEQYMQGGVSAFSPETDIYSLGATFYKLLTGLTPPNASFVNNEGLPVDELQAKGVSQKAIDIICKAMEGRKKDRMKSVSTFIDGLNISSLPPIPVIDDDEATIVTVTPKIPSFEEERKRKEAKIKVAKEKAEAEASAKAEAERKAREEEEERKRKEAEAKAAKEKAEAEARAKAEAERKAREKEERKRKEAEAKAAKEKAEAKAREEAEKKNENKETQNKENEIKPKRNKAWFWAVASIIAIAGIGIGIIAFKNSNKDHHEKEPSATEASYNYETFTVNGVSFDMVRVDGGTFTMGATSEQGNDAHDNEKPTHQVTLSSYYIGKTEVTQALWKAVMGTSVGQQRDKADSAWPLYGKGDDYPMYYVYWDDCQEFVKKLNSLTGKNFRLPTEAEWEYAARGGNKSQGYKYSGSNTIDDVAWWWKNSGDKILSGSDDDWDDDKVMKNNCKPHPVGTKAPNELGIYDMSGNVWEWCQDWCGGYSSGAQTNPKGPNSGHGHVVRGGSWWGYAARGCRVSDRAVGIPDDPIFNLGLRLVLSE